MRNGSTGVGEVWVLRRLEGRYRLALVAAKRLGISMTTAGATPGSTRSLVRMGATFLGLLAAMHLAYYADKQLGLGLVDRPYTMAVAWLAGMLAKPVLPYSVRVDGVALIADERISVVVASGCNGIEAILLMVAGVVAYPAAWAQRGRALVVYLPCLYALNLVRVVALTHIAHTYPAFMDIAHLQVAQGILILFVVTFWLHYLSRLDSSRCS